MTMSASFAFAAGVMTGLLLSWLIVRSGPLPMGTRVWLWLLTTASVLLVWWLRD
jgi:hypothetical protein